MKTVDITFLNFSWSCIDLSNPIPVPNDFDTIPEEYMNEGNLDLSNNSISETRVLPKKLKICNLSVNAIENWTSKMKFLIYLDISSNPIDDISFRYFPAIQFLLCFDCGLHSLDNHSDTLKYLDCSDNRLVTIPRLLPELVYLNVKENNRICVYRELYSKLETFLFNEQELVNYYREDNRDD